MRYHQVVEAVFQSRPNRFIAHCNLGEESVTVHVKNTGRCRELLVPGAAVYLEPALTPGRKTPYSLIAVQKGDRLINIDSQAPNAAAWEAVSEGAIRLPGMEEIIGAKRESVWEDSRFDIALESAERKALVEVKGVTLEQDNVALFPDAPTERGVKHIRGLIRAVENGFLAYLLLVIQMKDVLYFTPNRRMHPAFADVLIQAAAKGVAILAYECEVAPESLVISKPVPVYLQPENWR